MRVWVEASSAASASRCPPRPTENLSSSSIAHSRFTHTAQRSSLAPGRLLQGRVTQQACVASVGTVAGHALVVARLPAWLCGMSSRSVAPLPRSITLHALPVRVKRVELGFIYLSIRRGKLFPLPGWLFDTCVYVLEIVRYYRRLDG